MQCGNWPPAVKRNQPNKIHSDLWVRECEVLPGVRMLLRNLGVPGKHKLLDKWKPDPCAVEWKLPGILVHCMKSENGHWSVRVLLRNLQAMDGWLDSLRSQRVW